MLYKRRQKRMSPGMSRLYELQPDPYDVSQKRWLRITLFVDVKNAIDLRNKVRSGILDAAFIRAELVLEPFILLAAANRAVHQAAHNRLSTRSLSAEMIYSLSPSRNISDSLATFGIGENSHSIIVCVFDDKDGSKTKALAKEVDGKCVGLDALPSLANVKIIRQIYQLGLKEFKEDSMSDNIIARLVK